MSKIVKNNTASAVNLDVGVTIAASTNYTIEPEDYLRWAASDDIVTYVGDGTLTINDGSNDLGISAGIDLIKGLFPSSVEISNTGGVETSRTEEDKVDSIETTLMLHKILEQLEVINMHLSEITDIEDMEPEKGNSKL